MKVVKVLHYKAGYEVRTQSYADGEIHGGPAMTIRSAFTPSGDYIGSPQDARHLIVERGIAPEKADTEHCVCSIGYCEKARKWYGWSHRAIWGYSVGDVVEKGDCASAYLAVGFAALTLDDARKMAVAFARSVS